MPNRQIVNGEPYRYGYQGEFAETDEETGKPAFQLRIYDPRINRWLTPDPKSQYHSPYLGMGNNPISRIDPDGGTDCKKGEICGGGHVNQMEEITVIAKGNINRTGYVPTMADWAMLEQLRNDGGILYRAAKSSYRNGNYYKLTGGREHWEGFPEAFNKGAMGMDPNGTAKGWMNIAAGGIVTPLIATNPVTATLFVRESLRAMVIKSTASGVAQIVVNKQINFVATFADGFMAPGAGDFIGAGFDYGFNFGSNSGFYSNTILDNKSIEVALREGFISTIFSAKLHGLDEFTGSGLVNEVGQGMYHLPNQIANYSLQSGQ